MREGSHRISDREGGYTFAHLLDDASGVETQDSRVSSRKDIEGLHHPIYWVEGDRMNLDEELARARTRDRCVAKLERPLLLDDNKALLSGHRDEFVVEELFAGLSIP